MLSLAIVLALAAVLFLVTGGHLILIPLLLPLGLFTLLRGRHPVAVVWRRVN